MGDQDSTQPLPNYVLLHKGRILASFSDPIINGRYIIVDRYGEQLPAPGPRSVEIPTLGHGGFGEVVRVKDRIQLSRAVKLIDPQFPTGGAPASDEELGYYSPGHPPSEDDSRNIKDSFADEIRNSNARPFKNILPIIDYDILDNQPGDDIPYYVSPFIDGCRLDEFLRARFLSRNHFSGSEVTSLHDLLLTLVDDLLAAVEELEDAQVIHMDVKPSNIMVMGGGDQKPFPQGIVAERLFLIDLGAARSPQSRGRRIPLIRTPYYFPVEIDDQLGYAPADGCVSREKLMGVGSRIDLFGAGRVLEQMLLDRVRRKTLRFKPTPDLEKSEPLKEVVYREILEDDFEVLEGLISRLMQMGRGAFPSAGDARLAFQTVSRRASHSVFASRTLTDQTPGIRLRVGKALVRVAPPFDEIVDHPVFQRLRRLQQLSLLSEVFPDATHTRFAHLLGTFHTAKRFIRGLYRDVNFRLIFTQSEVEHVLAAALLHDIGQYAFSHTLEDLRKLGDKCGMPGLQQIPHDQELAAEYLARREGEPKSIREILEGHGFCIPSILYLINKTRKTDESEALNIGRDLISGAIDVDRVSYLLGDSERTGVSFGAAMDIEGLIEALCVKPAVAPTEQASLAIEEGGLSAVEAMLTAVYWMYRNVYWTHTNRGFMAAVKYVAYQLIQAKEIRFTDYLSEAYGRTEWDALAYLHRKYRQYANRVERDLHNPLDSITSYHRLGYRRIFSLGKGEDESSEYVDPRRTLKGSELYDAVVANVSPALIESIQTRVSSQLPGGVQAKEGEVLVDIPLKKRLRNETEADESADTSAEAAARPVVWVRKRGRDGAHRWRDLNSCSPLAARLGMIEDHSGRKIRVFANDRILDRLDLRTRQQWWQQIATQMEKALKDPPRTLDKPA